MTTPIQKENSEDQILAIIKVPFGALTSSLGWAETSMDSNISGI